MSMSWQTVELLKAVLCMAAIAWIGIMFLIQKIGSQEYRKVLNGIAVVITICGVLAYFNFGMFHWNKYPHSVHYYDIFHYHIGGKYFTELGYFDLYHATVIADQEHAKRFDRISNFTRIRDLRADRLIPWRDALKESERIKAKFSRNGGNRSNTILIVSNGKCRLATGDTRSVTSVSTLHLHGH